MEYSSYLLALLTALALGALIWVLITHGLSGRFLYVDKRNKDVTLHLTIFGTPRSKSGAHKVVSSLEKCLEHLKNKGYSSATFESHLISQKRMKTVYRIAKRYGYSVQNVSTFPTPAWQHFFIPFTMALLRFKVKFTNTSSTKMTIIF